VDTIPKIVRENPYRILGVYANSPKKDIVANKGKATAFLKVNKPVEYSLDLKGILPPLSRTLDLMNEAEAHLAIAKEQIKYAQFWFLQKMTPLDDIAFNHLLAGNIGGAIEIWSKQESLSSLQNKLVCYIIEDKPRAAVMAAEKLYEKFGNIYINKVDTNSTHQMTGTELLHQFLDTLGEEIGIQKLLGFVTGEETKNYIRNQSIGPLINKISLEVDKTKKVDHSDPKARIEAARKLVTNTKETFIQLKGILPVTDSQYQMIADKLGLEILQCGIDYFNNSEEDDAPHTAMKMQKYAQSVVVGSLAKQRCEENVKILQKIIDELPPKEVMVEDKAIKAELSKFVRLPDKISYAMNLLNNTKPHIQKIKQKLGINNDYYLRVSTQIVSNALHNVVEEVNEAQQPLAGISEILGKMDPTMRSILLSGSNEIASNFREIESRVKSTLREAWKATVLMDEFDMENSFKPRYRENRNTLKSICDNMGVSTYVSVTSKSAHPISKPSTLSSTTRSTTQSRPSTANSTPSKSSSSSNENNGCVVALVVMVAVGIIGAIANGGEGFFVGLFWGAIIGGIVYKVISD
jgi:hypothetical protein